MARDGYGMGVDYNDFSGEITAGSEGKYGYLPISLLYRSLLAFRNK